MIRRTVVIALLAWAVIVLAVLQVDDALHRTHVDFGDFRGTLWEPGRAILDGDSPYPTPSELRASPTTAESVYPPPVILAATPLSLLPFHVAAWLFAGIQALIAAVAFALVTRDRGAWLVAAVSAPVVGSIMWGNATPLVILAAAAVWRWRDKPYVAGGALAFGVCVKLFLAPVWLWLILTRRFKAAAVSAVASTVAILGAWAAIGFDGILRYPELLQTNTRVHGPNGVLSYGLVGQLGGPSGLALFAAVASAAVFFALAWRSRKDDAAAFALTLVGLLFLSPIVWVFYLGLLGIAVAAIRPVLGAAWWPVGGLWLGGSFVQELPFMSVRLTVAMLTLTLLTGLVVARRASRTRSGRYVSRTLPPMAAVPANDAASS